MRNITKYVIFIVCSLSLLALSALALPNPSNDSIDLRNNSDESIAICDICIDFIPYTHEELRDNSDTIVIGTVKEILSPRWNTIDGKQPDKPLTEFRYPNDIIFTDIVINVDEYLKNPLPSKEIIVRVTGGTIENISISTDADPSFKMGEKVLLYLSKDESSSTGNIGPEHFIVTDFYRGKYTLTEDGKAITPDEIVTLEELLSTIKDSNNTAGQSKSPEVDNTDKLSNNNQPLYAEVSGSLVGLNHTELSSCSDTIVIGTVKEILPSKWNTVDGKKFGPDIEFDPNNTIYTDIIINVDEYVKNSLSSKEVRVRVEGGTVGNDTLVVECEPRFQPGEKVLLFLMENDNPGTKDIGPEHFVVTGALQGKLFISATEKTDGVLTPENIIL